MIQADHSDRGSAHSANSTTVPGGRFTALYSRGGRGSAILVRRIRLCTAFSRPLNPASSAPRRAIITVSHPGTRRRIADHFSQTTLDFIPHNRIPHPFAGYKAKPTLIRAVREHTEHQQVIGCTASILVNLRNPGPAAKPGTSLHASAENGAKQAGKRER